MKKVTSVPVGKCKMDLFHGQGRILCWNVAPESAIKCFLSPTQKWNKYKALFQECKSCRWNHKMAALLYCALASCIIITVSSTINR